MSNGVNFRKLALELRDELNAERQARLEAERRVGELREQVDKLNEEAKFCDKVAQGIEEGLRAKLNTAMGLLDRVVTQVGRTITHELRAEIDTILNTTGTEGKDHA